MDSRSAKRKRYTDIKNMLVNDLHKLLVDSNDFNTEMLEANEDFKLFFRSMEDRQSQHLNRMLLIEEKYVEINAILNESCHVSSVESSSGLHGLPRTYTGDVRKFVGDSSTSLAGHIKMLTEQVDEMFVIFEKYGDEYKKNLDAIKGRVAVIAAERTKLMNNLNDYVRNV